MSTTDLIIFIAASILAIVTIDYMQNGKPIDAHKAGYCQW